tara:strand:+ start:4690 stop:5127 length:438 start_codon:yes stop_codon:yes gene_type:complete
MLMRRLNREFKEDKYSIYEYSHNAKSIYFKYNNINVTMILSCDYPFKPPSRIFVENIELNHGYFKLKPKLVLHEIEKRKIVSCQICDSFMCSNNWSPGGITLKDIAKQMITYYEQVKISENIVEIKKSQVLPFDEYVTNNILDYI